MQTEFTGLRATGFILFGIRYWTRKAEYTPQGLVWHDYESLRFAANAAFLHALSYHGGVAVYPFDFYRTQIDYMLGRNENAFSYQIGYGSRYPRRPHHRASSCPDYMETCDWSVYNSPSRNPFELTGALVSGPDMNDVYEDIRSNKTMNRVSVEHNAGFQSALAYIVMKHPPPKETTTTSTTTSQTDTTAATTITTSSQTQTTQDTVTEELATTQSQTQTSTPDLSDRTSSPTPTTTSQTQTTQDTVTEELATTQSQTQSSTSDLSDRTSTPTPKTTTSQTQTNQETVTEELATTQSQTQTSTPALYNRTATASATTARTTEETITEDKATTQSQTQTSTPDPTDGILLNGRRSGNSGSRESTSPPRNGEGTTQSQTKTSTHDLSDGMPTTTKRTTTSQTQATQETITEDLATTQTHTQTSTPGLSDGILSNGTKTSGNSGSRKSTSPSRNGEGTSMPNTVFPPNLNKTDSINETSSVSCLIASLSTVLYFTFILLSCFTSNL